jgi:hypothetical protein
MLTRILLNPLVEEANENKRHMLLDHLVHHLNHM